MCISVALITVTALTTVTVPLVERWVNNDVAVNIVSGLDKLPVNR